MKLTSLAVVVLISIALINKNGVIARKRRPNYKKMQNQAAEALAQQTNDTSAAIQTNAAVVNETVMEPKVGAIDNQAMSPAQAQQPQIPENAPQPVQPSMYNPPFPFFYPYQMMQPNVPVNSMQSGYSRTMSQSQSQDPGMISVSQFGWPVDESGKASQFQPPVPRLFYNPYAYNYGGYQPGVAYREVYFPTKEQNEAEVATRGASATTITAGSSAAQETNATQVQEKVKTKCTAPIILYHANVKPLSKEKQKILSWLKDPQAAVCKESFLVCQCDNNGKTERRWSFDQQSNKCVLYEDPCPEKNNNTFTALNDCLVSCWRM